MPLMPFTRSSGTTFTIFSRVGAKGIGQKGAPYRRMGASRYSMASSATVAEISAPKPPCLTKLNLLAAC